MKGKSLVCLFMLVFVQSLAAQEPQIRVKLDPTDSTSFYIGQKVTLVVELLAPGYFASAATFDLPDPPGLVLMPPAEHPIVSSEDQSGTSFTIQQHQLWAFPQRVGKQIIPEFKVRFAYKKAPLDKQEIAAEVQSQPIEIDVKQPPGTENLGVIISARELKAVETWRPEPGTTAQPGDAFVRSIVFTADDIPGSLFPPFPVNQIDGLGIYSKQQVSDQVERGELQGQRQTNITYLCKRPGTYQIPAVQLSWWDLEANAVKTLDFPSRSFEVLAPAAGKTTATGSGRTFSLRRSVAVLVVILAISLIGWITYKRFNDLVALGHRILFPFRAVHLQRLNPGDDSQAKLPVSKSRN